jgi:putative endonuclease
MTIQKALLGQIGEEAAVAYLKRQGYRIVEQNFRNQLGEIDIIAADGDTVCFIEVKTRNSDLFGTPFESVTKAKQRKIGQVALSYLKYKGKSDDEVRFDVISICVKGDQCQSIELLKNAFEYR